MKNFFETEAFILNVKEFQYSKGTGYSFSFPMTGEATGEDQTAPVIWVSGVSFNQPMLNKRNYLLRGKLQVKPKYKDYPVGFQLIVDEAILLGTGQYVVRTKRDVQKPEPHSTSNGMNDPSPRQIEAHKRIEQEHGNRDPLFQPQSDQIPF